MHLKLRKLYWIIGRKSQLLPVNKLLLYKTILTPICTYGGQLWGCASNSNLENLERFQSKSVKDNNGRTAVRAECGDKTRRTIVIGSTISVKPQCHLPIES